MRSGDWQFPITSPPFQWSRALEGNETVNRVRFLIWGSVIMVVTVLLLWPMVLYLGSCPNSFSI